MKPKALLFKRLDIQPNGMISGGFVQYSADDQTGVITYSGSVSVHLLFFSKDFPLQGTTQIDPDVLQSANIKPGTSFMNQDVHIEIISVSGGKAEAAIDIANGQVSAKGTAVLDLSEKDITILNADIKGQVDGYDVELALG